MPPTPVCGGANCVRDSRLLGGWLRGILAAQIREAGIGMRLRVGVVGLGNAWQMRHRAALLALSDRFDVRAVCAEVADARGAGGRWNSAHVRWTGFAR